MSAIGGISRSLKNKEKWKKHFVDEEQIKVKWLIGLLCVSSGALDASGAIDTELESIT